MSARALPALLAALACGLLAAGCQSTQSKSAEIGAELGPVKQEQGLAISAPSKDVEVLGSTVLSDAAGAAVVVEVRNRSEDDLAEVPIAIDVRDAQGGSVYRNDLPGLEDALTAIPYVPAGGTATWVHDQVLASGRPASVKVVVGAGGRPVAGDPPRFTATPPKLEGDPYSGVVAGGTVENESGARNDRVLVYAVARRGERVVAAGRGALEKVKAEPKPLPYNVYFIGDPRGAEVTVDLFPALPGGGKA